MFVSIIDVMLVSFIPPDKSGGYRMSDETVENSTGDLPFLISSFFGKPTEKPGWGKKVEFYGTY